MVNKTNTWKLTDAYEMGYEYECPFCQKHIDVHTKGKDLPTECPYCGKEVGVVNE